MNNAGAKLASPLVSAQSHDHPIHSCTVGDNNTLNCTLISDGSCDHIFMELRVICRTYQEIDNLVSLLFTEYLCMENDNGNHTGDSV